MTDREQAVLRAIDRVGRGGLALISDVIKALGYAPGAVKKTLVDLSRQGIVSLHRHDYPGSLSSAQRAAMIKLKREYYSAVTVRKKNPNPHGMSEKAWKASENAWRKSIAAYRAKGWTYQQIKDRLWLKFGLTLDKLTEESATFVPLIGRSGGFTLDLVPPLERRRMASKAKKQNPKRKKNTTVIKAKSVVIRKVVNPKRQRNLDHRDSKHQVEVRKHWRAGGLSQWQRAHKAGQHDLFAHGIKARNPLAKDSAKWEKLWGAYVKALAGLDKPIKGANARAATARLAKAEKAIQKFDPDAYKRLILGRKNSHASVSRHTRKSPARSRAGASSVRRATKKRTAKRNPTTLKKLASKAVKAVKRVLKGKRNPSAGAAGDLRKTFAGRHTRDDRLIFPDGTPQGLAKLGKLVSIDTDAGKIKPVKGTAWLCSDTRGKLHIGTPTKGHVVFSGPAQDFGKVREVEYLESKPHLGYAKQTLFFHKLGEETGVKPRLVTDGKGGARFVGGAYQIRREGIIN